jgi:hypothetical protein
MVHTQLCVAAAEDPACVGRASDEPICRPQHHDVTNRPSHEAAMAADVADAAVTAAVTIRQR